MSDDREAIRFYCGIGEKTFNHHVTHPGKYACISPVSGTVDKRMNGVSIPVNTHVIQDSGAFSDACLTDESRSVFSIKQSRLSFLDALRRQDQHAEKYGYVDQITHRASYDVLIDETWLERQAGPATRIKKRWTETDSEIAIQETILASSYLDKHRNGLNCVMSAQGVTASQYLKCAESILSYLRDGDIFGMGGWCITGKMPAQIMPVFRETMQKVIPFLGGEGVKRVHIWGVCYTPALGELLYLCDSYGIQLSTDSVGPTMKPVRGDWGYGSWRDTSYVRPAILESCKSQLCSPGTICRGLERARHVDCTIDWLANFRERESKWYLSPEEITEKYKKPYLQLSLFDVA